MKLWLRNFQKSVKVYNNDQISSCQHLKDANEFETPVKFWSGFTHIGSESYRTKPWPHVQGANNTESSNENGLVFREVLELGRLFSMA